jgi:hypothetical protein
LDTVEAMMDETIQIDDHNSNILLAFQFI